MQKAACDTTGRDFSEIVMAGSMLASGLQGGVARVEYLKSRRGRILLASFVVASALLVLFPRIDLRVSGLFYDHGFPWQFLWWNRWLHAGLFHFLAVSVLALIALYVYNRFSHRS